MLDGLLSWSGDFLTLTSAQDRLVDRFKELEHGLAAARQLLAQWGGVGKEQDQPDANARATVDIALAAKHLDAELRNIRTVMALAPMYNHLVVRADSDIKSYEDLVGKRVSPGKKGFTTAATFLAILKAMGSSEDQIEAAGGSVHWLDYSDAAQNMRDGLLDAVFSTSALPHSTYVELSTAFDIRMIPLSGELADKFIANNPGWAKGAIPGGRYPGVDEAVPTTVSYMGIATSKNVPDDVVYDFTKAVFEHRQKLADGYPAYRDIEPATFTNESLNGLPMHPAAEKFWKEQGLM